MTCDELRDHYELYAMGLAEEPEASEIRAHLERDCPTCVPGVRRARELMALLGAAAPPAEPSARLRQRVLGGGGGAACQALELGASVGSRSRRDSSSCSVLQYARAARGRATGAR